jgi:hypothetical protein
VATLGNIFDIRGIAYSFHAESPAVSMAGMFKGEWVLRVIKDKFICFDISHSTEPVPPIPGLFYLQLFLIL